MKLNPKDNYTCPQCDRTFPGILEFVHECTYNFTETNA